MLGNNFNNNKNCKMKSRGCLGFIVTVFIILGLIGEVMCVVKAVKCNWEPVGKAEVIYTGSAVTGLGAIVGYFDIEDK